ncbi:hypothetical protein D9M71_782590 [compost metagenome]
MGPSCEVCDWNAQQQILRKHWGFPLLVFYYRELIPEQREAFRFTGPRIGKSPHGYNHAQSLPHCRDRQQVCIAAWNILEQRRDFDRVQQRLMLGRHGTHPLHSPGMEAPAAPPLD